MYATSFRRRFAAFAVSILSAAGAGAQTPAPVRVQAGGSPTAAAVGTTSLTDTYDGTIAATPAVAWRVLPDVYQSLGLPVTVRDSGAMQLGNEGLEVRRILGGTMVSRYFTCGDARGGASSLTFELFLTIYTQLSTLPEGGTKVATQLTVKGKPMSYSGGWIPCGSSTVLEQRIVDGVNKRLQR